MEGDIGMPRYVHVGAGCAEVVIVALRAYSLLHSHANAKDQDDPNPLLLAIATVVTCGMMGGATWTWFVGVKKPLCFIPAALILVATVLTRPHAQSIQPAMDVAAFAAFLAGNVSAATIWHLHNNS